MGIVQSGRGLGIMAGPILGGFLYDRQGDYMMAFSLAIVLITVAIASCGAPESQAVREDTRLNNDLFSSLLPACGVGYNKREHRHGGDISGDQD